MSDTYKITATLSCQINNDMEDFIVRSVQEYGMNESITVNAKKIYEALEKQVAKKPIYSDYSDNGFDKIIPYKAKCPFCGYEFEFGEWNDEQNHHCVCGQRLDWSDEE